MPTRKRRLRKVARTRDKSRPAPLGHPPPMEPLPLDQVPWKIENSTPWPALGIVLQSILYHENVPRGLFRHQIVSKLKKKGYRPSKYYLVYSLQKLRKEGYIVCLHLTIESKRRPSYGHVSTWFHRLIAPTPEEAWAAHEGAIKIWMPWLTPEGERDEDHRLTPSQ